MKAIFPSLPTTTMGRGSWRKTSPNILKSSSFSFVSVVILGNPVDFIIKTPPTSFLLKKYAKINKGSVKGCKENVATISKATLKEIAEIKLPDLNAYDVDAAMKTVAGTAKNMGIAIEGEE